MNITLQWDCPICDAEEQEAEIHVTSAGHAGKLSGPPEDCYPAEGAEWEVEEAECRSCGHKPDAEWFSPREDEIQEKISEAVADGYASHLEDMADDFPDEPWEEE
jgi:hypothetical protein